MIARMGEANLRQLEATLAMDQTTLTRSLSLLERDGVIGRVPHPERTHQGDATDTQGEKSPEDCAGRSGPRHKARSCASWEHRRGLTPNSALAHVLHVALKKRGGGQVDVVSYIFTCIALDSALQSTHLEERLHTWPALTLPQSVHAEGFVEETEALREAWERNDPTRATQAWSDEMVSTLSASGTPDDVAGKMAHY